MSQNLREYLMCWVNMLFCFINRIWYIIYQTKLFHQIKSLIQKSTSVVSPAHPYQSRRPCTLLRWFLYFIHPPTLHQAPSESVVSVPLAVVTASEEEVDVSMAEYASYNVMGDVCELEEDAYQYIVEQVAANIKMGLTSQIHRWELPGNYPVSIVVMVIYHYVERIWIILVTPNFRLPYMIMKDIIHVNQLIYIFNH